MDTELFTDFSSASTCGRFIFLDTTSGQREMLWVNHGTNNEKMVVVDDECSSPWLTVFDEPKFVGGCKTGF